MCERGGDSILIFTPCFLVVCSRSQVRGATAQLPRRDDRRFTRKHSAFFGSSNLEQLPFAFLPQPKTTPKARKLTHKEHTHLFLLPWESTQNAKNKTRSLRLLEGAPRTQLNTYTNARKVTQNKTRTRLDDFRLPTNTAQDRLNEATKQAESDGGGVVVGKNSVGLAAVASRRSPHANARTLLIRIWLCWCIRLVQLGY